MKVTTVGIDLAKQVFQIHGVDDHGKAVIKKQLKKELVWCLTKSKKPNLSYVISAWGPRFT